MNKLDTPASKERLIYIVKIFFLNIGSAAVV